MYFLSTNDRFLRADKLIPLTSCDVAHLSTECNVQPMK